jgi:uncharacterized protein YrzB (UPF0473 family)
MEDNTITIIDESGKETEMKIIFTYVDEDTKKSYVFYFDPVATDGEVFVSAYDEDGKLMPITDEKEWEHLDELFEEYVSTHEMDEEEQA